MSPPRSGFAAPPQGGAASGLAEPVPRRLLGKASTGNPSALASRLWNSAVWVLVGFFVINLFAMIATVITSSFATRWMRSWFPAGWTTRWYEGAWGEFQLGEVLTATFQMAFLVVALTALIAVPAAYALARREFPGKRLVMLLILLPLLVPPITYGIPMATVLYRAGLAGNMSGVVLANMVPAISFVIIVMIPFVEQIDPRIEAAARVFGANTPRLFIHVLLPLLLPGMLAALLLVLVRTLAMFELTFLNAGPSSQTLVVALYYAVFSPGVRAIHSIDAMAVIYMATTMIWLLIALRFVNPTQIVGRARQPAVH